MSSMFLAPRAISLLLMALSALSCDLFPDPESEFGSPARTVRGLRGRPFGLGIAATGQVVALQLDTLVVARFSVSDQVAGQQVPVAYNAIDVAFTANGDRAYITQLEGDRVRVLDMATGTVVDSATFGQRQHRIVMAPDDGRYWVASTRGVVWAVDRASGAVLDSVVVGDLILRGLAHRASTGRLAVVGDGDVLLLDAATLDVLQRVTLGGYLSQDVAFSQDGTRLFVAQEDLGRILVLDATTLAVQDTIAFPADTFFPFGMRLSPDGSRLVVSSYLTGLVAIIDPQARKVRQLVRTGGGPRRIAFTPDGSRAFVTNEGGWVDVIK